MAAIPPHGLNLPIQSFLNQRFVCTLKLLFPETNQTLARELKCLRLKQFPRVGGDRRNISNGERKVCFSPGEGFVTTSVYDRYHLRAGERVPGPAIVEKLDSTILIHPNYQA